MATLSSTRAWSWQGLQRCPSGRLSTVTEVRVPLAQMVEERCVYRVNEDNSGWTEIRREAWVSSSLFGVSRAVQVSGVVGPTPGPRALCRQGR